MKIKATILPATGKREYAILRWDEYQALLSAAGDEGHGGPGDTRRGPLSSGPAIRTH